MLYIFTMIIGIQQDGVLFHVEKEASVIVEKKTNSESSKTTLEKLKEMASNEGLIIYTYNMAEENQKTYYFLNPQINNELRQLILEHRNNDYDNRNKVLINENGITEDKIHALYVLGNENQQMTESLLNKYELNYGMADIHFEDNSLKVISSKYIMLIIIFFIITIASIYLDIRERRKQIHIMDLTGIRFVLIMRETIVKHSIKEFGIGLLASAVFLVLFFPLTSIAFSSAMLILFLISAYLVATGILYYQYHKNTFIENKYTKNTKIIWSMQLIYTIIVAIMLFNLAQISHFIISNNNIVESFEINKKVYSMVDITSGLTIEKEKDLSDLINEKPQALYIQYQPIFTKENSFVGDLEADIDDTTYAGYAVNKNYLEQYRLVPEQYGNTIFVPESLKSKIPQFRSQSKNMNMTAAFVIYDDETMHFNTFDPQNAIQSNLILIYEPEQIMMNNSFYFCGENKQSWQNKINNIYKKLNISNLPTITSYEENNIANYYQVLGELSNFIILGGAYLFSSIYLIVFIVNEYFMINKRLFMLQVFYGRSIINISGNMIIIFGICHFISTMAVIVITGERLTTLVWTLLLYCLQLATIYITMNYLLYKKIPLFLKGEE